METIKDDLKKLKLDVVNVVDKKLLVDEIEYVCKSNNITQLEIKKDFLSVALEKSTLKEILIHFSNHNMICSSIVNCSFLIVNYLEYY